MEFNLYEILELDSTASQRDIKNAYRRLAKKYHPDKKGGNSEMFDNVAKAYTVLGNLNDRKNYDHLCLITQQSSRTFLTLKKEYKAEEDLRKMKNEKLSEKEKEKIKKMIQDTSDLNSEKMGEGELIDKMRNVELVREDGDIENYHHNIFKGREFSNDIFNNIYEKTHMDKMTESEITTYEENPLAAIGDSSFYGSIYDDSCKIGNTDSFCNLDDAYNQQSNIPRKKEIFEMFEKKYERPIENKLSKEEMENNLEKYIQERNKIKSDSFYDFSESHDTVVDRYGGYGISNRVGLNEDFMSSMDI